MKKYNASPSAEIIGSAMRNFFVSINKSEFEEIVQLYLNQAGITTIEDDEWYPHQLTLDIFKSVEEKTQNQNLVALGMAYVETASFPADITNIQSALGLLADTYHLNVRNTPDAEGYQVTKASKNHIQIIDNNPFPHDTVYGFIWGICRRFKTSNEQFTVHRTYLSETEPDSNGAIYDIEIDTNN